VHRHKHAAEACCGGAWACRANTHASPQHSTFGQLQPHSFLPGTQLVKGDIQSMDLLSFVLQAENIDTIMHYAAQVRQHIDAMSDGACRPQASRRACTLGCHAEAPSGLLCCITPPICSMEL